MFFRRKRKDQDILAMMEKQYGKKEVTLSTLVGDIYNTGKTGLLTAFVGGFIFPTSSAFFGAGMYNVYERIFVENSPRFSDNAGLLIAEIGLVTLASVWGTKQLAKLTMRDYELFKKHRQEYRERIEKSKA